MAEHLARAFLQVAHLQNMDSATFLTALLITSITAPFDKGNLALPGHALMGFLFGIFD